MIVMLLLHSIPRLSFGRDLRLGTDKLIPRTVIDQDVRFVQSGTFADQCGCYSNVDSFVASLLDVAVDVAPLLATSALWPHSYRASLKSRSGG